MLRARWILLLILLAAVVFDLGVAQASGPAAVDGARPGFLTGSLTRADGKPIPGMRGRVAIVGPNGTDEFASTDQVDVSGQYSLRLPPDADYRVRAFADVPFDGRTYRLELEPTDGSTLARAPAGTGLVKDFRLRLRGPRTVRHAGDEGLSSWGQTLEIAVSGEWPPAWRDARVEIALTPHGRLVDGTEGEPITSSLPASELGSLSSAIHDIPLGVYTASARLLARGAVVPLSLSTEWPVARADTKPSVLVRFEPEQSGGTERGGARPAKVVVHARPLPASVAGVEGLQR